MSERRDKAYRRKQAAMTAVAALVAGLLSTAAVAAVRPSSPRLLAILTSITICGAVISYVIAYRASGLDP